MGCPACGADRLKSAPLIAVSALLTPVSSKRRYRCDKCKWTGWKHRLKSVGALRGTTDRRSRTSKDGRAITFALAVLTFMAVVGFFLTRSCGPDDPAPIEISPTGLARFVELDHV